MMEVMIVMLMSLSPQRDAQPPGHPVHAGQLPTRRGRRRRQLEFLDLSQGLLGGDAGECQAFLSITIAITIIILITITVTITTIIIIINTIIITIVIT
jgi:hypothetical protein